MVVAGAIIIFLTMMMIVRERRREIGVLKAIGASNVNVVPGQTIANMATIGTGTAAADASASCATFTIAPACPFRFSARTPRRRPSAP